MSEFQPEVSKDNQNDDEVQLRIDPPFGWPPDEFDDGSAKESGWPREED